MKNLHRFNEFLSESTIGDFAKGFAKTLASFDSLATKEESKEKLPLPFKNNEEGNKFRKWVNEKYPEYAKKIYLSPSSKSKDGYNNEYIKKAWEKYGEEYTKDKK